MERGMGTGVNGMFAVSPVNVVTSEGRALSTLGGVAGERYTFTTGICSMRDAEHVHACTRGVYSGMHKHYYRHCDRKVFTLESTPRISSQDSDAQTLKHSRGAHEYRVHTDRICSGEERECGSMPGDDEWRPT